jgi:hypothetical protein
MENVLPFGIGLLEDGMRRASKCNFRISSGIEEIKNPTT